jgi:hypothetical protein
MVGVASPEGRIGAIDPDSRKLINSDGGTDGFPHADFALNTQAKGVDGFMYRFVQANGAIPASQSDSSVDAAGQLTAGGGTYVNTTAFADNEYGWVRNAVITADAT